MGAIPSSTMKTQNKLCKNEAEVVMLMMPVYYSRELITEEENDLAAQAWTMILEDRSPVYVKRRETDPNFHHHSCAGFFYDNFYRRLFDLHPLCRPLFKSGIKGQGKFLVNMLSFALSQFTNADGYDKVLYHLAEGHSKRGVRAVEYGIVGEVLFWTLRETLGPTIYTPKLHDIWVKIFSRMLKTIVPIAVAIELRGDVGLRNFEVTRTAEDYTNAYTMKHDVSSKRNQCPVKFEETRLPEVEEYCPCETIRAASEIESCPSDTIRVK